MSDRGGDDLAARLREWVTETALDAPCDHVRHSHREVGCWRGRLLDAADALDAKDAEIERLRSQVDSQQRYVTDAEKALRNSPALTDARAERDGLARRVEELEATLKELNTIVSEFVTRAVLSRSSPTGEPR